MNQKILFALGVASAVAVELLAQGPWAHAVWAPVAIMLFTDLGGVTDAKKSIAAIPQRVRLLLGAGAALAVELLAGGRWAHAVWAPAAIMLFTDFSRVMKISPPAELVPVPVPATPPPIPDSTEAVTPLDKPR